MRTQELIMLFYTLFGMNIGHGRYVLRSLDKFSAHLFTGDNVFFQKFDFTNSNLMQAEFHLTLRYFSREVNF